MPPLLLFFFFLILLSVVFPAVLVLVLAAFVFLQFASIFFVPPLPNAAVPITFLLHSSVVPTAAAFQFAVVEEVAVVSVTDQSFSSLLQHSRDILFHDHERFSFLSASLPHDILIFDVSSPSAVVAVVLFHHVITVAVLFVVAVVVELLVAVVARSSVLE